MYQQQQQYQQPQAAQANGSSLMVQGRIVWTSGNLFSGKVKVDDRTKQPVIDQKTGLPVIVYGFGLAVPKMIPGTNQFTADWIALYQACQREALTLFPGGNIPQDFSMKYKDCDVAVDKSGTLYSAREGHAGHILVACTTQIPIKYFRYEGGNNILVNEGFKNGDYVNVQLNIKAHPALGQGKAGLYMNPSAVQFIQAGKEIINTPSGDQVFGVVAPAYAGEVVAHTAPPMPGISPGMGIPGGTVAPGYAQPAPAQGMPGQQYAPQPNYAQPPAQPHYGVLPQTHQPAPAQGMPGQQYAPQPNYAQPPMGNAPMPGAPVVNGQTQYPPINTAGQMVPGQQYAPPAYPSNGMPPMPPR